VLQEREVAPLGGGRAVAVDFAVIAATHRDLDDDVGAGRFRADLFYRIAQARVHLPALRDFPERRLTILELWRALGAEAADMKLEALALARLASYDWPGNLRQLLGVLRTLIALAEPGRAIGVDELPAEVRAPAPAALPRRAPAGADDVSLDALERDAMQSALERCAGNVSAAARRLGVSRSTLYRRLGGAAPPKGH